MFRNTFILIGVSIPCALLLNTAKVALANGPEANSIEKILQTYVDDFRSDRFASQARVFGIEVPKHGVWTVTVDGVKSCESWNISLRSGRPSEATFIYKIEPETLHAIHAGSINALTAQGKASSDDYTPMSVVYMDGFEPTIAEAGEINPFSFHFWTRGFPEVIPFRDVQTREGHGSNFGAFFYQPGLRSCWYRVKPGERVHAGPREQAMPFPILAIATVGVTEGEIDGERISLSAGNAVLIPANAQHKWWNDSDSVSEAIVVMFGDGA